MTTAFSLAGLLRVRGVTADTRTAAAGLAARRLERTRTDRAALEQRLVGADDAPIDAASLQAIAAARASSAELLAAVDALIDAQARELADRERERSEAKRALRSIEKLHESHRVVERRLADNDERRAADESIAARVAAPVSQLGTPGVQR